MKFSGQISIVSYIKLFENIKKCKTSSYWFCIYHQLTLLATSGPKTILLLRNSPDRITSYFDLSSKVWSPADGVVLPLSSVSALFFVSPSSPFYSFFLLLWLHGVPTNPFPIHWRSGGGWEAWRDNYWRLLLYGPLFGSGWRWRALRSCCSWATCWRLAMSPVLVCDITAALGGKMLSMGYSSESRAACNFDSPDSATGCSLRSPILCHSFVATMSAYRTRLHPNEWVCGKSSSAPQGRTMTSICFPGTTLSSVTSISKFTSELTVALYCLVGAVSKVPTFRRRVLLKSTLSLSFGF